MNWSTAVDGTASTSVSGELSDLAGDGLRSVGESQQEEQPTAGQESDRTTE